MSTRLKNPQATTTIKQKPSLLIEDLLICMQYLCVGESRLDYTIQLQDATWFAKRLNLLSPLNPYQRKGLHRRRP